MPDPSAEPIPLPEATLRLRRAALAATLFGLLATPAALAQSDADAASPAESEAGPSATRRAEARQLPTVTVHAEAESRATTEGSSSYTTRATTIGLGEHALRETPNSVSVVTRQRIEDQNFLTVEDAMKYTTAMKVTTYGTNTQAIESRGYTIDHYQIDGISSSARVYENNFGLAMYDRIEVWRGPTGLLQGTGDPGGTINFVRKRALDSYGLSARTLIGSHRHGYGEIDVTGPLDDEGRLRGRLVASYLNRHYFVDYAKKELPMVYGTLEYDLTPQTTLSIGTVWQREETRPFFGIAAYDYGGYPRVQRSTYIGAAWNHEVQQAQRSFIELEHKLDSGGSARLSAIGVRRRNQGEIAWGSSFVDAQTGDVEMIPYFSRDRTNEATLDARLIQPWQWLGQRQEFVVGASHQRIKSASAYNSSTWGENGFIQNIFAPDVDVPKPEVTIDAPSVSTQTASALFGQIRLKPIAPLTVLAGARVAWYRGEQIGAPDETQRINARWVPYAGLIHDLTQTWSAYASYSSIFSPQSDRNAAGAFLPPRKGNQLEVGLKGSHFNGTATSSLAIYRIDDVNRAIPDPDVPNAAIAAGENRSEGAEFEFAGRLTNQWEVTVGYGYNRTKQIKATADQQGRPFTTVFPKHTFSVCSNYRFGDGPLLGANLGAGMRVRSGIYSESDGIRWSQGGLAVLSLQGGYQFSPAWRATLTVENLTDRHYFDRPEAWSRQTYFGEPRSVMLALSYRSR